MCPTRSRMTPLPSQFMTLLVAGWLNRHQREVIEYLQEESRVLREQIGGQHLRFSDAPRCRLARRANEVGRVRLREVSFVVTPDTLLRWYRELVAKKYDGGMKRGPGSPRVSGEMRRLIVEMATESSRWGYTRIQGALANPGHAAGRRCDAGKLLRGLR